MPTHANDVTDHDSAAAGRGGVRIYHVSDHDTVEFAASELREYLNRMTGEHPTVARQSAYDPEAEALWVDVAEEFGDVDTPPVSDSRFDDAIRVNTDESEGVISGNNPRSVLLATYRYLSELGCEWVRPGPNGEVIPEVESIDEPVDIAETPSSRHRGITIEGAVSFEHVRDMIDWAPKRGFNAYFLQFFDAYPFWQRWYEHQKNPHRSAEPFSEEDAEEYYSECIDEIKRRGMLFHAVGHGWTARALDLPVRGWAQEDVDLTDEQRRYVAEIDGERELYEGIPANTELCYSNPEARRLLIDELADHAETNPEVDVLHLWLSDGHNNHCECEDCRERRPSDFYVTLLNELDDELSERNLDVRVAFLIYTDLLWPPEIETVDNPERFSLMFAPITRTYSHSFAEADPDELPAVPPYERNDLDFPRSVEGNVAFLQGWWDAFDGDGFDFDYHLMWDHYNDPGFMETAELLAEDMSALSDIGLNGNVSCQVQRVFLPTGLPMSAMGETLWDETRSFDDIADEYFEAAFGSDGAEARTYLERVTDRFDPEYIRGDREKDATAAARSFAEVPNVVEEFRPTIQRNLEGSEGAKRRSWRYLDQHADLVATLGETFEALARGDQDEALDRWENTKELVQTTEDELHHVFDVFDFIRVLDERVEKQKSLLDL